MTKKLIKQGWGMKYGQNFKRAAVDMPFEMTDKTPAIAGNVLGYVTIDGYKTLVETPARAIQEQDRITD